MKKKSRSGNSTAAFDYDRYLPTSPRDSAWGLVVTGAGCGRVGAGSGYPRQGHPASHKLSWQAGRVLSEYQVVYIPQGEGEFESDLTGPQAVPPGTVLVLFPGVWHRYRPLPETGWEEYWVGFQGEDADRLRQRGFLCPEEAVLSIGASDALLHAFGTLLARVRSQPVGFQPLVAVNTLEIVAIVLAAVQSQRTDSRLHELIRRAKLTLEDAVAGLPVMESLAASLGISPSHFQHLFKEHTGLSPYQYHLQLKIARAKEMLLGPDFSVKQVASALHFRSVYHFSKLFKRKTGVSPSQWRNPGARSDPDG